MAFVPAPPAASAYVQCPPGAPDSGYCMPIPTTVNTDDQLRFDKAQTFFRLSPGQTRDVTVACPHGDLPTDGSALVQQVDQGSGSPSDILVTRQAATGDGYAFTVTDPLTGSAQGQAFAACVSAHTSAGETLHPSAPIVTSGSATGSTTLSCPANDIAIDPSWDVGPGTRVVASTPEGNASEWTFTLASASAGVGNLSIECLPSVLAGPIVIDVNTITGATAVGPGQEGSQDRVDCPSGSSGIVGGWSVPGGALLGDEPQDRARVFSFADLAGGESASMALDCLEIDTETIVSPTAGPLPGHHGHGHRHQHRRHHRAHRRHRDRHHHPRGTGRRHHARGHAR
jgi:hypothetical protein